MDGTYVVIQSWMCSELKLKSNDLLVYALIYGFSQDGESVFNGSRSYIAEMFNISLPTVDKALNNLLSANLIEKISSTVNNVTFNSYKVVSKNFIGSKETLQGVKKLDPIYNNINNTNKDNTKTINNKYNSEDCDTTFQFGETESKKPNLYQKCMNLIDDYITKNNLNPCIKTTLKEYLDVCMEMRCIRGANQWKGMLNTLEKISNETGVARGIIVQQSIEHGWKTFYPVNNFQPKNKCVDNVQSPKDNNEYHPVLDENGNPIVF
jgi:predicted transcriptional regulator